MWAIRFLPSKTPAYDFLSVNKAMSSRTSFLAILFPPFAASPSAETFLVARRSNPVDVLGRVRGLTFLWAPVSPPPRAPREPRPATDGVSASADAEAIGPLRRAATTSGAFSMVCTGTRATTGIEAGRSLFLLRPPFGLGLVPPSVRSSPAGEGGQCVVGDDCG